MQLDQLETPVPVVDLNILETNIAKFQSYLDEHGIDNRPHIKTHKIPEITEHRAGMYIFGDRYTIAAGAM